MYTQRRIRWERNNLFKILKVVKGGRYLYCKTDPIHPKANSNDLYHLHRVVVENRLGRLLESDEHVHHLDGDKLNASDDNLVVLSPEEHAGFHAKTVELVTVACANCKKKFSILPSNYKYRLKRNKMKKLFCKTACSAAFQHGEAND